VLQQVLRANQAADPKARAAELLRLRESIDVLLLSLRVGKEGRAFCSFAGYLQAVEQVGEVH